jgi:serine/threonine-protein kinase
MAAIEFRTLGTLDLRSADGRELHSLLAQSKRIALLAYLCLAQPRGFHRRDKLVGLFWPDADQEHARTSLRKSLHIVRQSLGEETVISRGDDDVAVDFDRVSCDAIEFEKHLRGERLEQGLDMYRGDLLPGFFVDETPEFDQWLTAERARLRSAAARGALKLAEELEKKGDVPAAVSWARRSLSLSDTDEASLRRLLELQTRAGDRAGAMQTYDDFAGRLAAEYHTEPSNETKALIDRIRAPQVASSEKGRILPVSTDETAHTTGGGGLPPGPALRVRERRSPREMILFAVALLGVVASAGFIWRLMQPPQSGAVVRYTLTIDSSQALSPAIPWAGRIAISPDGSRFAYLSGSNNQLVVLKRNELRATPIPGGQYASTPFFSPDGRSVGLLREQRLQIGKIDGGPLVLLDDSLAGVAGASWSTDGYIYTDGFRAEPLARIEARPGARPAWFTELDKANGEIDHSWPQALPNGKGVLFTVTFNDQRKSIRRTSFAIAVAEVPSGKHRILIYDAVYPRYTSRGLLLYVTTEGTMMAVPFDQNSMTVTGEPTRLIEGMHVGRFGAADLDVSKDGTLIYSLGADREQQELVWRARDGTTTPVDANWHSRFFEPSLSPDGKALAVVRSDDGRTADIWVKKLDRGAAIRLTHDGIFNRAPAWTPDGTSITFVANPGSSQYALRTQRADGTGGVVDEHRGRHAVFSPQWSSDSRWLIFMTDPSETVGADIIGIRPGLDTVPVPLVASQFQESEPALSPDGHWLAYACNESGRDEIYVVPFPNTATAKYAISSGGGGTPVWAHSGKELFFRDTTGDVFAASLTVSPRFTSGKPRRLFAAPYDRFPYGSYSVSPDDQRILMVHQVSPNTPDQLIVVENWFEELNGLNVRR